LLLKLPLPSKPGKYSNVCFFTGDATVAITSTSGKYAFAGDASKVKGLNVIFFMVESKSTAVPVLDSPAARNTELLPLRLINWLLLLNTRSENTTLPTTNKLITTRAVEEVIMFKLSSKWNFLSNYSC